MKIYTRTGDAGTTSLVGGARVSKASARLEAYGTIDELNSHLGLLAAMDGVPDAELRTLRRAGNKLFNIGAYLATDNAACPDLAPRGLGMDEAALLEQAMDAMEATLPPLRAFILPGGCPAAAQANVARAVCRRAERRVIALAAEAPVHPAVTAYINRLSDYLFTLGRHLNHLAGVPEREWAQEL